MTGGSLVFHFSVLRLLNHRSYIAMSENMYTVASPVMFNLVETLHAPVFRQSAIKLLMNI